MQTSRQQLRPQARTEAFQEVSRQCPPQPRRARRSLARRMATSRWKRIAAVIGTIVALSVPVAPAQGQGTRKDDIVFNSRGVPLAGATVRVCTMPASGQPCTPLAQIFSDAALTQALANPTTTDGLGNYFFYAAPGKYEIEISGPGITTKQSPNVILPSDPASPSLNGINWQNWPFSDVSASANSGAAIGLLPANGGAVNVPPHYRETFTSHINLGSGTQPVKYLLGQDSLVTCNVTDASYCFKVFNASSMAGSSFGALGSRSGGSVLNTLATTNVASLVTNDQSTASEYFSLENLAIDNSASGTVTSLLDLGNIFVPSRVRDVTLIGGPTGTTNGVNVHGSATSGENTGDITFDNDWVNCASGTGCTPLNIINTNTGGSVQRLTFHSGAYEHPGNTLPVVNADGSTGGGIYGLNFESNRFEGNSTDTSTSFAKFNNVNQVTMLSPFFLPLSGGSAQYGAELSGTINGFVLINGRNGAGNMVKNNITGRNVQATYVPLYVYGTSYFDGALNLNAEAISSAPRTGCLNAFLPGALTSAWTGTTCTLDKAITVTRIQVQAKTAPSGCSTNAAVRVTDGATPQTVTVSAAANDSGALAQNYAAGAVITVSVSTAAAGCGTNPADANVSVQYKMQ